ncbi:MAG: response regulator transcription factor [Chloroflexaceae bacterium]|nr:response regulator transcription factor [Chloroflexaceae bacterium]
MTPSILLVEDDAMARTLLTSVLKRTGYEVTAAPDGETAIQLLSSPSGADAAGAYDVVITDIRMPGLDGIEVMQEARKKTPPPAVILMTGYGSVETAITALRCHAYDYLLKPCDTADLLRCVAGAVQHRVAEQRRADAVNLLAQCLDQLQFADPPGPSPEGGPPQKEAPIPDKPERFIRIGDLCLDLFRHVVTFQDQPIPVTPIEFAVLRCLSQSPGRVFSHQEIIQHTHGSVVSSKESQALLRPHVHNLRRKIASSYLVNVRGKGYMLVNPEATSNPARDPLSPSIVKP